jgi:hypothetical protein
MALVKGSKVTRVKVIEYRYRYLIIAALLLVLFLILSLIGSYFWGHQQGLGKQKQALADVKRLSVQTEQWRLKAQEFEQLLENSKIASQVDRQASEEVRQEIIALKDEVSRLGEENTFYKGLMAPNEKESGLTLGAVELLRSRDPKSYDYKIVIQQLAQRHNLLNGYVSVTVRGRQDGIETSCPLMLLSESVSQENIKVRFNYFQVLEGSLGLPEGFEPEGLQIEARTTGRESQLVSKNFGWLVEEV